MADAIAGGVIAFTPIEAADYGRLGVDRVVPTTSGWTFDPETRIAAISALFNSFQPSHIILPETSSGGGHLGRLLATRLNLTLAAGVVRLKGAEVVRRVDGGRLDQTIAPAQVILLAPEAAEPVIGPRREAQRLDYPVIASIREPVADEGFMPIDPLSAPLEEADFIVSAGVGVSDWESFARLANLLGAAIGCTRAVCDAGRLPRDRQVGASGTLVDPRCYLSFGISGAPQQLQGIARCERVIAVNTDLHAEMIKRANLAVVADAQAVMPALLAILEERR